MRGKTRRDLIAYLAFAMFGLILWFAIPALIPGKPGVQVDSRLFPRVIAVFFMLTGGVSAATAFVSARRERMKAKEDRLRAPDGPEQPAPSRPEVSAPEGGRKERLGGALRAAAMVAIIVAYALLVESIGFIPSTALAVTAVLLLERVRKPLHYVAVYAACALLYVIFRYLLYVQL